MDTNHNGQIDPDEAEGGRRYFVTRLAERAGVEAKFPLAINRIQEGLKKQYQADGNDSSRSGSSGGSSDRSDRKDSEKPILVPGFGVETSADSVLKFGEVVEEKSAGSSRSPSRSGSSNSSSSSRSSSSGDSDERIRRWAEAMLRQYDRNRNGRLESDESRNMRSEHRSADRNHDGVITLDELTARLSDYSRGSSRDHDSRSRDSGGSDRRRPSSGDSDNRKSFRSRTPTERLPDGLPDWFAEKDANGDGQVAMAEYATFWTISTANEFSRWDPNDDGLITPGECLAVAEQKEEQPTGALAEKKASPAKRPWGGFRED